MYGYARKALFVAFMIASCSAVASAADQDQNAFIGNIHAGNWAVAGGFSFSHSSANQSVNTISIIPSAQYFLIDHLAVGLGASWSHSAYAAAQQINNFWSLGPSVTYYFTTIGTNLGLYAAGGVEYQRSSSDNVFENLDGTSSDLNSTANQWMSTVGVGAHYFLTPSVAFGPGFSWVHYFGGINTNSSNEEQIFGSFAIFL